MSRPIKSEPQSNEQKIFHISDKYQVHLQNYLERRTGSKAVAMELTQDTFEKFLTASNTETINNPRAYLFRTARNLAINHLRRENIYVVHAEGPDEHMETRSNDPSPDEWLSYTETHESFRIAFEKLPRKCQEIFYLSRFTELSSKQIAKEYGISRRMVHKHLAKAMKHFKKQLEKIINEPL